MVYFRFFNTHRSLFTLLSPTLKKIFFENPLNYYFLKNKNYVKLGQNYVKLGQNKKGLHKKIFKNELNTQQIYVQPTSDIF